MFSPCNQPYLKQTEGFNMQFLLYKPSLSAHHGVCNIYSLYARNPVIEPRQLQQKFLLLACQRNLSALPGRHILQKWIQKFFHISTCSISEHIYEWDFEVSHPRCVLFNINITMYELVRTQVVVAQRKWPDVYQFTQSAPRCTTTTTTTEVNTPPQIPTFQATHYL